MYSALHLVHWALPAVTYSGWVSQINALSLVGCCEKVLLNRQFHKFMLVLKRDWIVECFWMLFHGVYWVNLNDMQYLLNAMDKLPYMYAMVCPCRVRGQFNDGRSCGKCSQVCLASSRDRFLRASLGITAKMVMAVRTALFWPCEAITLRTLARNLASAGL